MILGPTDVPALGLSVDLDRLAAHTLRLVGVRSYPGEEAEIASEYAGMLAEAGADVRIETSVWVSKRGREDRSDR